MTKRVDPTLMNLLTTRETDNILWARYCLSEKGSGWTVTHELVIKCNSCHHEWAGTHEAAAGQTCGWCSAKGPHQILNADDYDPEAFMSTLQSIVGAIVRKVKAS